jgi:GalNAc-alpha-(1->4)-GalNAc-alpha-(1->3)-diNAcBac-PP-undecaprenol alpha-1,4-N-acetyl-D-galactosaminyltransferase
MSENNKKILFLINNLGVGGAEKVFVKTANALIERGYNVYFAFLFGDKSEQILLPELNVSQDNIFYCKVKNYFDVYSLRKLNNFIKINKINTIYSTLNQANIFSRFIKILNHKIKVIIREANVAGPKPFSFKILDIILNIFVKKIICVSDEVKISLLKYQPFYKHKMIVLMNGVEIPKQKKVYENLNLPINILNVGSLTKKKGQKYLIEACAVVQKQMPDSFELNIVGSGVEKDNLKNQIIKLGLDGKIAIIGSLPDDELQKYYLSSDIFVLSSIWEGCPNVLLEAASFGLACVSTDVSGVKDIVKNNISGKLVPTKDAFRLAESIMFFIKNSDQLKIYGDKVRKITEDAFSMNLYINKFINLINE